MSIVHVGAPEQPQRAAPGRFGETTVGRSVASGPSVDDEGRRSRHLRSRQTASAERAGIHFARVGKATRPRAGDGTEALLTVRIRVLARLRDEPDFFEARVRTSVNGTEP